MKIFTKKFKNISAIVLAVASALILVGPNATLAATNPGLGAAESFSIIAQTLITGISTISGDVGSNNVTGGVSITALTTANVVGTIYALDLVAPSEALLPAAVQANLSTAYTATIPGMPIEGTPIAVSELNGVTRGPGVYDLPAGVVTLSGGVLTLDGPGTYVFRITTGLTSSGSINLINGARACDIFWRVGSLATINGTSFAGTILAGTGVHFGPGVTLNGRALAVGGDVTLGVGGTISGPTCAAASSAPATTPYAVPSYKGTINVVKTVINDNGGTKTVADFSLFVDGMPVVSGETNSFRAPAPAYTVTETANSNYTRTFSGDCDRNGQLGLNPGNQKFCVVTNDDIGPAVAVPPVPPLIDMVKTASPLSLPAGSGSVVYTYTLRNTGTVPVANITIVGDTCSPIILASGDTNGNSKLDLNETWVHTCTQVLSETHTNTAVATGWANGISAVDIASATVVVGTPLPPPLIHLVKMPNVFVVSSGGAVTYTYTVTNPGTAPLDNVSITDDKCTGLPSRVLGHPGDLNKNDLLESNEAWSFTCQTNLTQTTTNIGTARGSANGLTATDLSLATVVVIPGQVLGATTPNLPNTGFPPEKESAPWNIAMLAGIFAISIFFFYFARRKQTI